MRTLTKYIVPLALLALLSSVLPVKAGAGCDRIQGNGQTFAVGPATFQGFATVQLDGQSYSAAVTTNLLGPPKVTEDGTLLAHTSHTFVFDNGSSFTTFDNAILSPTSTPGLYNLNTRAEIIQGTGDYDDASGALGIHGTINFLNGEVAWRFTGQVCNGG